MRFFLFALLVAQASSGVNAKLPDNIASGSWANGRSLQVQGSNTLEMVFGVGLPCEVPMELIPLPITSRANTAYIFTASESDALVVAGCTISFPADGLHQVQTAETYKRGCVGRRTCEVQPHAYIVIAQYDGGYGDMVINDIQIARCLIAVVPL